MTTRILKVSVVVLALVPTIACGGAQNPLEPAMAPRFAEGATEVRPAVKLKGRIALNKGSEVTVGNPDGIYFIRVTVDLRGTAGFRLSGTAEDVGYPWPAFTQCDPATEGCSPGTTVDASLWIYGGSLHGEASVKGYSFEFGGMHAGTGVIGTIDEMNLRAEITLPPAPAQVGSTVTVSTPFTMDDSALGVPTPEGEWPFERVAFGPRSRPSGEALVTLEWRAFEFTTGTPAWAVTSVRYVFD
jgi:hypothetical protein